MTCKLSSAKLYIRACATLHNYLLRAGEEAVPLAGYEDDVDDNDDDDIQVSSAKQEEGLAQPFIVTRLYVAFSSDSRSLHSLADTPRQRGQ